MSTKANMVNAENINNDSPIELHELEVDVAGGCNRRIPIPPSAVLNLGKVVPGLVAAGRIQPFQWCREAFKDIAGLFWSILKFKFCITPKNIGKGICIVARFIVVGIFALIVTCLVKSWKGLKAIDCQGMKEWKFIIPIVLTILVSTLFGTWGIMSFIQAKWANRKVYLDYCQASIVIYNQANLKRKQLRECQTAMQNGLHSPLYLRSLYNTSGTADMVVKTVYNYTAALRSLLILAFVKIFWILVLLCSIIVVFLLFQCAVKKLNRSEWRKPVLEITTNKKKLLNVKNVGYGYLDRSEQ
jgi:hypothetical protein